MLASSLSAIGGEIERQKNVTCIGLGVYYESRGESPHGQRAVASVINNRVADPRFPDTACEVLFQPKQFSFLNRGSVLSPFGSSWATAVEIGDEFVDGKSENDFLYFSNERSLKGTRIGRHIFR